jgi:hypothetical protein
MNTLFTQVRKSIALLTIGALLSTMVVVSTASAEWYDSAVARLGDASYATMGAAEKNAALTATTSRQDAAVILHRALGGEAATITELPFTDKAAVAPYAMPAVLALVEAGVIKGNPDGSFTPAAGLNRAEFAVMLERAGVLGDEMAPTTPAVDAEFVGVEWAKPAFQKAAAAGIIQGYPDGTWRPAGPVNKAEAFVLSDRATGGSTPGEEVEDGEDYDYTSDLKGGAGDVTIVTKSTNVEDEVVEGEEDVIVLGFEVEAEGSDVALSSLRVELNKSLDNAPAGSDRLDRVATEVSVWQGDREVGRVDASEFTENNDVYSESIALDDAVVREDDKVRFYVAITGLENIDSKDLNDNWKVVLDQVRFEDATGTILSETVTGVEETFEFEDLSSSGELEFRIAETENSPEAGPVEVSKSGDKDVLLTEFTVSSKGGDLVVDTMPVSVSPKGAALLVLADELVLTLDGDEIDSVSTADIDPTTAGAQVVADAATGVAVFTDLEDELELMTGETYTLAVMAKVNPIPNTDPTYAAGSSIAASVTSTNRNNADVVDMNDDDVAAGDRFGTVVGEDQRFYAKGITTSVVNNSFSETTNDDGDVARVTHTMEVSVTAFGETYYVPFATTRDSALNTAGFNYQVEDSANAALDADAVTATSAVSVKSGSGNVPISGNYWRIDDGKTVTFTVTVTLADSVTDAGAPGFTRIQLLGVRYDDDTAGVPTNFATTPQQDYETTLREIQVVATP